MTTKPKTPTAKELESAIGSVLGGIMQAAEDEEARMTKDDLEEFWFFKWDECATVEWNTYQFYDLLKLYAGKCRRWEEKHNGCVCVVERVRDTYIMPKIRAFLPQLAATLERNHGR